MYLILFVLLVIVVMVIGFASIASSHTKMVESSMKLPPPIVNTTVHSVKKITHHTEQSDGSLPGEKLDSLADYRKPVVLIYPEYATHNYDYSNSLPDISVTHDYQPWIHNENEDFMESFVDYNDS